MTSIRSDASQLRQISKSLRAANPAVLRAVRRAVREEGKKIVQEAQQSSGEWSTRIPPSFKVTNNGLVGITIRAGGDAAPHAAPYENKGRRGNFRHPLNYPSQGSRQHWVSQQARPFLLPSLLARAAAIRESLVNAAIGALKAAL